MPPIGWHGFATGTPLPAKPILLTFDDGYQSAADQAFPLLQRFGYTATSFIVTAEIGGTNTWNQQAGFARQELMTADQIRYWSGLGFEFGPHSRTHPDLRSLPDSSRAEELEGSRMELELVLGKRAPSFAYPFGFINDTVCEAARKYYELAFTCNLGINSGATDPMRLCRAEVIPKYGFFDPRVQVWFGCNPFVVLRTQLGLFRRRLCNVVSSAVE